MSTLRLITLTFIIRVKSLSTTVKFLSYFPTATLYESSFIDIFLDNIPLYQKQ
jgi:hypothetical protein